MTMNLLIILLVLFIIISLAGDIIIARKLNKHEEEYRDKYNKLDKSNFYNSNTLAELKGSIDFMKTDIDFKFKNTETDYKSLHKSITSLQESDKENCDAIVALRNKVDKLSEPEQATKEQILQVLDEQNVLTSSIKDGTVILEEK